MENKIVVRCNGANAPTYQSAFASGADLKAYLIDNDITLCPGSRVAVNTGLRLEIPVGYEGQVRPRSGLAIKHGITVLNSPGTIDSDYRGEVMVILINLSTSNFVIKDGDRIAQLVITKVEQAEFQLIDEDVATTARGAGGFGSTGV